jgi:hypothetical protein
MDLSFQATTDRCGRGAVVCNVLCAFEYFLIGISPWIEFSMFLLAQRG